MKNFFLLCFLGTLLGVQAPAGPANLLHRYRFDETNGVTVSDSVGGTNWNGVLQGTDGSQFTGDGRLFLGGTNGYVALPKGIISSLTNFTIEVWATAARALPGQRLFDFGTNNCGIGCQSNAVGNCLLLTPYGDNNQDTGRYNVTGQPQMDFRLNYNSVCQLNGQARFIKPGGEYHYVLVYDARAKSNNTRFYLNGILAAWTTSTNSFTQLQDVNNWLGRSQRTKDKYFQGYYNELRIWNGVLTGDEIARHYAVGPETIITRPGSAK